MVRSLEKGIENYVMKKFPWVVGYEIKPMYARKTNLFVEYYVDPALTPDDNKTYDEQSDKLVEVTYTLFEMLGLNKDYSFGGVSMKFQTKL
jgi:hypothetical protein